MTTTPKIQLPALCPANSFRKDLSAPSRTYLASISIDLQTGLMSLSTNLGVDEMRHDYEWLTYQEPESHCSGLSRTLQTTYGVRPTSKIGGLSWKDAGLVGAIAPTDSPPLILHLRKRQVSVECLYEHAWVTDSIDVQESVTKQVSDPSQPRLDFLSARHILEHAVSIGGFLSGLATLVQPDGQVLIEVPDCEPAIRQCDYSILWEEHRHYFTIDSMQHTLRKWGWRIVDIHSTIADGEAILLAIARPPSKSLQLEARRPVIRESSGPARNFIKKFNPCRTEVLRELRSMRNSGTSLYVLGANHMASNFMDLFGESGIFTACLDDHPDKQGSYMSRFGVPVIPIESHLQPGAAYVISAIHPSRRASPEDRLLKRQGKRVTIRHLEDVFVYPPGG